MIIKEKPIKTILYASENPIEDMKAMSRQEKMNQRTSSNSVLFCRYIGMESGENNYVQQLKTLDEFLQCGQASYLRFTEGLKKSFGPDEIEQTRKIMENYIDLEQQFELSNLYKLEMGFNIKNKSIEWTKKLVFRQILKQYDENNPDKGLTIRINFGVKMLLWMDEYLKPLFEAQQSIEVMPKVVFYGNIKAHEFYFLIFLSQLGCDVLYINSHEDINFKLQGIERYANLVRHKETPNKEITFPIAKIKEEAPVKRTFTASKIQKVTTSQIEKSYEDLALIAESVVLIRGYDSEEKVVGIGSGVVINPSGYILTNFHVVCGSAYVGVCFENDENEYLSQGIFKYHEDFDLALIKVERNAIPVGISTKPLVRGQKIIAIGSPLGLMNTISEGIVSGFREFKNTNTKMVQITAPISPGSSGGALIDLYGNLVGITTAGFEGENLNMAVPSDTIQLFANNLITTTST